MKRDLVSPALGWLAILVTSALVAVAVGLFRGSFTPAVPVTVLSPRAGLVMNVDARVKMRGVEVGKVDYIETAGRASRATSGDESRTAALDSG